MAAKGSTGLRPRIRKTAVSVATTKKQPRKIKRSSKRVNRAPKLSAIFSPSSHPAPAVGSVKPVILPSSTAVFSAPSPVTKSKSKSSDVPGKVSQLSKSKSKDVQIPAFGFIDVCFCVDSTGSMAGELAQVQEVIKSIITNIEAKVSTEGLQLRFAIVSYRDHPPQESSYVTQHLDFTDQFSAINYVKTLSASGGGDEPEAVHDGLLVSAKKLNWV